MPTKVVHLANLIRGGKFYPVSGLCSVDSSKGTVVNCYIPLLGRPQQCLKNFNDDYFDNVAEGNNTHACR